MVSCYNKPLVKPVVFKVNILIMVDAILVTMVVKCAIMVHVLSVI